MKIFYFICLLLGLTTAAGGQEKFSGEQLRHDADELYRTILDVHPYMFTAISREAFEREHQALKEELKDSMTAFDFYRLFAPLVSKLEDGHTELHYPVELAVRQNIPVFPYTFTVGKADTTLVIRGGLEGSPLRPGARIVSIDGIPAGELIGRAYRMLSGEAYHYKMERLNFLFSPLLYFIHPAHEFRVEYVFNDQHYTTSERAMPLAEYLEVLLAPLMAPEPYSFTVDQKSGTAVLSLGSFDIYDREGKAKYRGFLDSLFREVKTKGIGNLVIDVRTNGGGLEELVWDLFQYISPVPFQTKGPSIDKLSETVKNEYDLERPAGIYLIGAEGLIPLRENPLRFEGNTYLLTSHFTFSSASKMAWAFQYFGMGRIIGEETGGLIVSYGNVFDARLPNTGLPYGVSKWKFYGYGATDEQAHGVLPEIRVPAEAAMERAFQIIEGSF